MISLSPFLSLTFVNKILGIKIPEDLAHHLPKKQLIVFTREMIDMIWIWKVFGRVISF
jgi:hypothetical protein